MKSIFPFSIIFDDTYILVFHRIRKQFIKDREYFLECQKMCEKSKNYEFARFFSNNAKDLMSCLKALDYIGKYHIGTETNIEFNPSLSDYIHYMFTMIDLEAYQEKK